MGVSANLRTETAQRLEAHGVILNWISPANTGSDDGPVISFELVNGLRSILREAVSNTLRHAKATALGVKISQNGSEITLDIEDDGKGLSDDMLSGDGNGIPNIKDRAEVLMGSSDIGSRSDGQNGAHIRVTLPLDPDELRRKTAE